MSDHRITRRAAWAALAIAGLLCLPALAQDLATVNSFGSGVEWTAQVPNDGLILTVSGGGYTVQTRFDDGARPYFEPYDENGDRLPDGVYNWELVVVPRLQDLPSERFENGRSSADGSRSHAGEAPERQVMSGTFRVQNGSIAQGGQEEAEAPASVGRSAGPQGEGPITETVISGDLTVYNSLCVGFDCATSESYGDNTIRLKENNLRIHFDDTSNSGSFPNHDWRIVANDSANGGANKFSIEDSTAGRTPFTVTGSSPNNSIFVDSSGRVGFRTSTPVLDLHVKTGNTPALRLEQDGSSGFASQIWDVAGNETTFFIRDATNGSTLPFRIRPGAASSTLSIDSDSQVGVGTVSPGAKLDVVNNVSSDTALRVTNNFASNPIMMSLVNTTSAPVMFFDSNFNDWTFSAGNTFNIATGGGATEMQLSSTGNLTLSGNVITTNCPAGCGPDYVFEPDYELMPLEELGAFVAQNKHLPKVPPAVEMETSGINMTQLQLRLLEKVEELTLYTIAQHETIQELQAKVERLEGAQQD
ncbi:MAG: hypothetical protein R2991_15795 [Thermoanaerobaculia bacterium]